MKWGLLSEEEEMWEWMELVHLVEEYLIVGRRKRNQWESQGRMFLNSRQGEHLQMRRSGYLEAVQATSVIGAEQPGQNIEDFRIPR